MELQQGKNIADAAAATVDSLDENGFVVSTLSYAAECSGGRFGELYHFDAKAEVFPNYVRERYPALAGKMSCVQTGFFMTSYRLVSGAYFTKVSEWVSNLDLGCGCMGLLLIFGYFGWIRR